MVGSLVNYDLRDMERSYRGLLQIKSLHLPGGIDEIMKNLGQDSRTPGRGLNPVSPANEAGGLPT
jgi:hypothetical protein